MQDGAHKAIDEVNKMRNTGAIPVDAVSKTDFIKTFDTRREQEDLNSSYKPLVRGLPTDWSIDDKEILDSLNKGLPFGDAPADRPALSTQRPVPVHLLQKWEVRKAATQVVNALTGRRARVGFGTATDRLRRMRSAAAADVARMAWGSPAPLPRPPP